MIKHVLELPPKLSLSIRVNLESRYGTWVLFPSVRAVITCPKVVRLLLIVLASSRVYPVAPVFATFSLPARSTRYNLPYLELKSVVLF